MNLQVVKKRPILGLFSGIDRDSWASVFVGYSVLVPHFVIASHRQRSFLEKLVNEANIHSSNACYLPLQSSISSRSHMVSEHYRVSAKSVINWPFLVSPFHTMTQLA